MKVARRLLSASRDKKKYGALGSKLLGIAAITFAITSPVLAQNEASSTKSSAALQAGIDAYEKGDYPTALKQLIPLANKGDANAQLHLGLINELGQGVQKNTARAVMRYRQAANQGNAEAQFHLGEKYELGQGVPQSKPIAMEWYDKSAAQKYPPAQARVNEEAKAAARAVSAELDYWNKVNAKHEADAKAKADAQANKAEQLKLTDEAKAAARTQAVAAKVITPPPAPAPKETALQAGLDAYQQGDYATALKQLIPLANKGDANAQLHLGLINELGQGVQKNSARAVMRYRQAANQGNAEAQFHLGEKYELGQGVPQSKPIAMEWYNKSANQKYPSAQAKVETEANKIARIKLAAEANERAVLAARVAEQAKLDAEAKTRAEAERARAIAEQKAIAQAKTDAEAKQVELAKIATAAKAAELVKAAQEAKLKAEAQAKADEAARVAMQAKLDADAKAKADAEAKRVELVRIASEAKAAALAKAAQEAKLKIEVQAKAEEAARAAKQAKFDAEQKTKADAEAKKIELAKIAATAKDTAQITTPNKVVKAEVVPPTPSSPKILVERSLMDWAAAWSNKNVHEYLSAYAYYFKPKGLSHEAWKKQRAERISKPKIIEVSLSNIAINVQDENHVSVTFIQHYRSDDYHDEVEKSLLMVKEFDRWLIAQENVIDATNKMAASN